MNISSAYFRSVPDLEARLESGFDWPMVWPLSLPGPGCRLNLILGFDSGFSTTDSPCFIMSNLNSQANEKKRILPLPSIICFHAWIASSWLVRHNCRSCFLLEYPIFLYTNQEYLYVVDLHIVYELFVLCLIHSNWPTFERLSRLSLWVSSAQMQESERYRSTLIECTMISKGNLDSC